MKLRVLLIISISLFSNHIFTQEICDNRIDDDGDGKIDCFDGECDGDVSCWECDEDYYQVHSNSKLVALNPGTGAYYTVADITGASQINGAQMSHYDGHVYAPCIIDGNHTLGLLKQDGTVVDMGLDLPGSSIFYVGGVDVDGKLYMSRGSGSIYYVDLTQEELTVESTSASATGVADFAVDNTNGLFYGINGSAKLKVFDPYSEDTDTYTLAGSINDDSGAFGAAWSSVDGSFFAYNNSSGKIYTIDTDNLTATEVLNGVGNLSINDGFNCLLADPPLESNCGDGEDNDGDGLTDCEDGDCLNSNECMIEICDNGIDDDGDGWIDCSDTECFYVDGCYEDCDNGIDDNDNGLVDSDDPQCETPGGIEGGLESNGYLSDKIALRNYQQKILKTVDLEAYDQGLFPFISERLKSSFSISSFIPTDILDAYVSESSPQDLLGITNAIDVKAADYFINENRIGTVLGIHSENVYEHTKYICDRLDGSRLLDVSHLYIEDGLFMSYELLNSNLNKEYAVSFSAYYEEGLGFTIENHWNLHKYTKGKNYYNFQVWARSYGELISLVEAVIQNMKEYGPILEIINSELPRLFVSYGEYKNGSLLLQIKNKSKAKELKMTASIRRTESSEREEIEFVTELEGLHFETFEIPVGHLYDLGASFESTGSISDEIFLADGTWAVDENIEGNTILDFQIFPQSAEVTNDSYQIERSVRLEAQVLNYLNIYRSLNAKFNPLNFESYNTVSFEAQGNAAIELTIVKESIEAWEEQFRANIELTEELTLHTLNLDEFKSTSYDHLDLSDVTAFVFTVFGDGLNSEDKSIVIQNLTLENSISTSNSDQEINATITVGPNPAHDHIQFVLGEDIDNNLSIIITNTLGQKVYMKEINGLSLRAHLSIDIQGWSNGMYFYSVETKSGKLNQGSFLKI